MVICDKMDDELDDFLAFVDIVENVNLRRNRLPKRYIRDMENPMEFYEESEFRKRYRFPKIVIRDTIMPLVEEQAPINNRGLPIPKLLQMLITLRFFATGSFQIVTGDLRGVSQATVSRVIKRISVLLAQRTRQFVQFPNTEMQQRQNIRRFYDIHGFPSVSGCIDCTHIAITNPGGDAAEVFRNRKQYFSLNVQVVAGPRMEILDIVAGSAHNNTIFERSVVGMRYRQRNIRGLLLGDNGYACRNYILTPLVNPQGPAEVNYNQSHIMTRNIVERLFGLWKRRFPCLHRVLRTRLQTTVAIICATAVLHNIAVAHNLMLPDEEEPLPIVDQHVNNGNLVNQDGLAFRRLFI